LRGVYKKSQRRAEELLQEKLVRENQKTIQTFSKIPQYFHSLEQWPSQTNLFCWHCSNSVRGVPIFIPKHIDAKKNINNETAYVINVEGVFCTFNCAQAYLDTLYSGDLSYYLNRTNMLLFLYSIFNGRQITYIRAAPPKYCMIQYGGNKTIAEYEKEVESYENLQIREVEDNSFASLCNTYLRNLSGISTKS
jgi:hypothetical protein